MKSKSIRDELVHAQEMLTGGPDCIGGMTPLVSVVYDKLGTIIERLDALPAVAWSIGHDENGEDGIITKEALRAQNWMDDERTSEGSILALYPLDIEPIND